MRERRRGRSRACESSRTGPSSASARQSASAAQAARRSPCGARPKSASATPGEHPRGRHLRQRGAEQARELGRVAGLGGVGDAGGEPGGGHQDRRAGERDRDVAERPARARDRGGEQRLGAAAGLLAAQAQHGLDGVARGDQGEDAERRRRGRRRRGCRSPPRRSSASRTSGLSPITSPMSWAMLPNAAPRIAKPAAQPASAPRCRRQASCSGVASCRAPGRGAAGGCRRRGRGGRRAAWPRR